MQQPGHKHKPAPPPPAPHGSPRGDHRYAAKHRHAATRDHGSSHHSTTSSDHSSYSTGSYRGVAGSYRGAAAQAAPTRVDRAAYTIVDRWVRPINFALPRNHAPHLRSPGRRQNSRARGTTAPHAGGSLKLPRHAEPLAANLQISALVSASAIRGGIAQHGIDTAGVSSWAPGANAACEQCLA